MDYPVTFFSKNEIQSGNIFEFFFINSDHQCDMMPNIFVIEFADSNVRGMYQFLLTLTYTYVCAI